MYEKTDTAGKKIKRGLRNVAILYTLLGSAYMLGQDTTGHYSADLHECKVKPTKLEMIAFEELGVNPVAHCDPEQE